MLFLGVVFRIETFYFQELQINSQSPTELRYCSGAIRHWRKSVRKFKFMNEILEWNFRCRWKHDYTNNAHTDVNCGQWGNGLRKQHKVAQTNVALES